MIIKNPATKPPNITNVIFKSTPPSKFLAELLALAVVVAGDAVALGNGVVVGRVVTVDCETVGSGAVRLVIVDCELLVVDVAVVDWVDCD